MINYFHSLIILSFSRFSKKNSWFVTIQKITPLITVLNVNQDLQTHSMPKSAFQLCGVCGNFISFFFRGGFCFFVLFLSAFPFCAF